MSVLKFPLLSFSTGRRSYLGHDAATGGCSVLYLRLTLSDPNYVFIWACHCFAKLVLRSHGALLIELE